MYYLLTGAVAGTGIFALTRSWIPSVVAALFSMMYCWIMLPALNPFFHDFWILVSLCLLIGLGYSILGFRRQESRKIFMHCAVVLGSAWIFWAIGVLFLTPEIFRAKDYAALLGKIEEKSFEEAITRLDVSGKKSTDATVLDQEDIWLVDHEIAARRATEILGQEPALGNTYHLGRIQQTRKQGQGTNMVWAAPLEYNGFFRWLLSPRSPAFVWVDAHDARKAKLVTNIDGTPVQLRCLQSAWGFTNVDRVAWSANPFQGITDPSFEIDDRGRPVAVYTTYKHGVGFSGEVATGVNVVDIQSCATKHHSKENLPSWVNRMIPDTFVAKQTQWWGRYSSGYFHQTRIGSASGILLPSVERDENGEITQDADGSIRGIEMVPTAHKGNLSWYVGMIAPGNPNGTTGFMLVDAKTGKATYIRLAGATEFVAAKAILGKQAEKQGYKTSLPLIYNINGPTYLAITKDREGNAHSVGIMPVDDRNTVIVQNTLQAALEDYSQRMSSIGISTEIIAKTSEIDVSGKVTRINSAQIGGQTVFFFILEERPDIGFVAGSHLGINVVLTQPGDTIQIKAQGDVGGALTVQQFSNLSLNKPQKESSSHPAK